MSAGWVHKPNLSKNKEFILMKKLLSAALAAVLTLSLAACSNAPEAKE